MNITQRNKIKVGNGLTAVSAIVLVMLIFFMVMVVAVKKEDPSKAKDDTELFDPVLTVIITEDNQYYLLPGETEKDKRYFDDIKEVVGQKMSANEHRHLKIEGHKLAKYETIYNIAHMAEINNWEYRLFYTVEQEGGNPE